MGSSIGYGLGYGGYGYSRLGGYYGKREAEAEPEAEAEADPYYGYGYSGLYSGLGATEDTDTALDTAVVTPPLDTPDLDTAVDTTEDSAMALATMESVRLRLSLRLIPTTVTVTLDSTDLDTAVATPLLDTLVLATAVATTDTAVDTDTMVKPNVCLDEIFFNF